MEDAVVTELEAKRAAGRASGSKDKVTRLRSQGKLLVRERLDLLLDKGSFEEIGILAHSQNDELRNRTPADGTVVGSGKIDGRRVFVGADDPTVLAGTRGRVAEVKMTRVRELALQEKKPFISLNEAGAARVQENRGALCAELGLGFEHHFQMSGLVPQVSAMLGPSFGGPSFIAAQGDFTAMVAGTGFMGMSGPPIVKVGIGVDHSAEEIGGVEMATKINGQVNYVGVDEADTITSLRRFLSYFPSNAEQTPPRVAARPAPCESPEGMQALMKLVPENQRRAYDMVKLLHLITDEDSMFPISPDYGKNLVTTLARMGGQSVGIIANNPSQNAGVLDEKAAVKARKFIDLCDAFHIPLIFFSDSPGFLIGPMIERHRTVSLASRLLNSLIAASVPKITIVLRKAVGLAYIAMCGRACHPNAIVSWPTAFFDVMGPEAGVVLVHGKEIAAAADPASRKQEILAELEAEASAYATAGMGFVDDIIAPLETRPFILKTLERAEGCDTIGFKHRIDP
ncbi:acyl-CoA carboxylase subunit beta [Sneathiella sp.]|uniref:acyl-CoA carboxylase subunit beta n=1 Tax=Sneathiella sp. TaxID=1964365 RepID=UPI00356A9301